VTAAAQDDEVLFAICARLAPADHVVDLEPIAPAAVLAFPAIPLQDFQLQLAVTLGVEPKPPSFSKVATHAMIADIVITGGGLLSPLRVLLGVFESFEARPTPSYV
jgi:hypothetical protein